MNDALPPSNQTQHSSDQDKPNTPITPNTRRILLVCRTAPYGNALARESLETALAAGAIGAKVAMLFLDEGVWQLAQHQKPQGIGRKNHSAMLGALPLYDIDTVLVDRDSLSKRCIDLAELGDFTQLIDSLQVKEVIANHDVILSF